MRLFVAAELPKELTDALSETLAVLRGNVRGRFVAPDSLHVTLAFLGNVESSRANAAAEALEEACRGVNSFDVTLGELGSFGRRAKATLWQGFSDDGALPELAHAVRESLRARGFAFDAKSFIAHVTLMRSADLSRGTLAAPYTRTGCIDTITLLSSDLSGDRPVYEPVCRVKLPEPLWGMQPLD